MNYTLNQLRVFLKIAETESITLASEQLNLTQPAVSIQLKNFQNQFEQPLTEIIGKRIYITQFGKEIAEKISDIIQQLEDINNKTMLFKGELKGKLKISVVSTAKYIIPYFMVDFIKKNKSVELQIDVTNKNDVIQSIENNEVDLSLVSILPAKLPIETLDLLPNKVYLVGKDLPDEKTKIFNKSIFKEIPLIFREKGSGTRQLMENYIEQNKITVFKKLELTSNEAVKQALIAGLGYSMMPVIGLKNELMNGELQILPIKGTPIKTKWSFIWHKNKNHSPIVKAFLSYIEKNKKTIIEEKFKWYNQF